jgi:phytoene dehydrogenase-like protein
MREWDVIIVGAGFAGAFIYMPSYGDAVGQHQFHALYQGHYDELPDLFKRHKAKVKREIRELLGMVEQETFELFPRLKDNYHWKIPHVEIYGIAQSPGFAGNKKPSMKPPGVGNLYIVSYTVEEARGVGMQAVARGALMAADAILGND